MLADFRNVLRLLLFRSAAVSIASIFLYLGIQKCYHLKIYFHNMSSADENESEIKVVHQMEPPELPDGTKYLVHLFNALVKH